jgi:glycosyltransferase involved in cell wall biosynthesis
MTTQRRNIVFLQRVLSGGGAERVVRDLAANLDRDRYQPWVLTLFDIQSDSDYPRDIPVLCVRKLPPQLLEKAATEVRASEAESLLESHSQSAVPDWAQPCSLVSAAAEVGENTGFAAEGDLAPIPVLAKGSKKARFFHSLEQVIARLSARLREITAAPDAAEVLPPPAAVPTPAVTVESAAAAAATVARQRRHQAFLTVLDNHWPAAEGLRTVISELGPNTRVISVMEEATVAAWLAQQGGSIPFIASLHTLESQYLPAMYPEPVRGAVEHWAFGNACRNADKVVFPTRGCGEDLVHFAGVERQQIRTIGNPVDCRAVQRAAVQPAEEDFRREGEALFVSIARLDPVKDHRLLFSAFAQYRAINPRSRLVCIGDGPEREALSAVLDELGLAEVVHLLGNRENPYPILRQAQALVLTSVFESFALVLVEAMVCGVPVISVDCPFGPREVLADGQHGLLVPPGDAAALSNALLRISTDEGLRQKLISSGSKRALEYDIATVVRQWEELIEESFAETA